MEEHYKESYALKSIAFRGTGSGQELGRIQPLESHWTRSLDWHISGTQSRRKCPAEGVGDRYV